MFLGDTTITVFDNPEVLKSSVIFVLGFLYKILAKCGFPEIGFSSFSQKIFERGKDD